jgi:hypothetical protein
MADEKFHRLICIYLSQGEVFQSEIYAFNNKRQLYGAKNAMKALAIMASGGNIISRLSIFNSPP